MASGVTRVPTFCTPAPLRSLRWKNFEKIRPQVVHSAIHQRNVPVNKVLWTREITLIFPGNLSCSRVIHGRISVNKYVHKKTLAEGEVVIGWSQFIERTEMESGGQQIDAESLKD